MANNTIDAAQTKIVTELVLMVLRHAMTAGGVAGVLSNDELSQIVGSVVMVGGLVWSAIRKINRARTDKNIVVDKPNPDA